MEFNEVNEQTRTYYFGGDKTITIKNVVKFAAPGTTHRLETSDGRKIIVGPGWLAIEITADEWSL